MNRNPKEKICPDWYSGKGELHALFCSTSKNDFLDKSKPPIHDAEKERWDSRDLYRKHDWMSGKQFDAVKKKNWHAWIIIRNWPGRLLQRLYAAAGQTVPRVRRDFSMDQTSIIDIMRTGRWRTNTWERKSGMNISGKQRLIKNTTRFPQKFGK